MKVFTAQQMRDFDRAAVEEYGIPSIVLMENAALRVVEFLEAKFAPLSEKKIVILCGKGNNGGDGLVIARHLMAMRARVVVFLSNPKSDYSGDALKNLKILELMSDYVMEPADFEDGSHSARYSRRSMFHHLRKCDVVVDALYGTRFSGEIRSETVRHMLSALVVSGSAAKVIAVDLPSGFHADTGQASEKTPYPSAIITFVGPKRGMFVQDGNALCRKVVWVGDIGASPRQINSTQTGVEVLSVEWGRGNVPRRRIDAHKGDAGRVLIIGGSLGMSGAVALAAKAALSSGCGLCTAAIPEKILPIFAASVLEATSHPLPCDEAGKLLESAADELPQLWKGVQVVALGPGIGRNEETQNLVRRIARECPVPLIIDADALHALPAIAKKVKNREAATILTPHPGEMGVLMGMTAQEVNESRFETALACAKKYGAIVVLKGAKSLIATPSGEIFVNLTGNAGMATGGSGDVLTGTIAGILAQFRHPEDATKLGVYLHGYAGDMAFEERGNGLAAGDIAANLARALVESPKREVEAINGRLRRLM